MWPPRLERLLNMAVNRLSRSCACSFSKKWIFFITLPGVLTGCGSIPNASSLTIQQMIINIANTMPDLLAMFSAITYVIGFLLVLKGIYKLKEYGEMRTSMSSQTNLWPPLITITIGTLLIFFISTYQVGLQTLFSYTSPLAYTEGSDSAEDLIPAVVSIMQVVGVIAFIRGMLLLNNAGHPGAQQGGIGKGLAFIIGGLLAINIYGTFEMLINTITGV